MAFDISTWTRILAVNEKCKMLKFLSFCYLLKNLYSCLTIVLINNNGKFWSTDVKLGSACLECSREPILLKKREKVIFRDNYIENYVGEIPWDNLKKRVWNLFESLSTWVTSLNINSRLFSRQTKSEFIFV